MVWISTAVRSSVAAAHAGTPADSEISEQETRKATPDRW